VSVADFVRREILRHFSGDSADEVERVLLTATADPGLEEPDRIHSAILRIADGDLAATSPRCLRWPSSTGGTCSRLPASVSGIGAES